MVHDQYQPMSLVIHKKTCPHKSNVLLTVYSSLACSGQWSGNEIILLVTVNLNFWSHAIFRSLPLLQEVHQSQKKITCEPDPSVASSYPGWRLRKPQFWNQCAHFHISGWTPYIRGPNKKSKNKRTLLKIQVTLFVNYSYNSFYEVYVPKCGFLILNVVYEHTFNRYPC